MGSLVVFVRNLSLNPIHITFFRFSFAFLFLFAFMLLRGKKIVITSPKLLFYMAIINVAIVTFYVASIQLIPAGMAALLLYMAPIYVILIAYLKGEKINRTVLIALPLSISGLYLMLSPQGYFSMGMLFGLIAGFSYAVYFFVIKRLREEMQSLEITTIYLGISALILLPGLILIPLGSLDVIWLIGLGLIPTAIAFTFFNYGIKYCKVEEAPLFALVEPVSATIFGFAFYGEVFTELQIFGAILILTGVAMALKKI